jgi:NIMA (never in mitosis gene a)-related kinase
MEKYQKIKQIGKGNYGKAMLVKDNSNNKFYVLKTIDVSNFNREQLENALYEVKKMLILKFRFIN